MAQREGDRLGLTSAGIGSHMNTADVWRRVATHMGGRRDFDRAAFEDAMAWVGRNSRSRLVADPGMGTVRDEIETCPALEAPPRPRRWFCAAGSTGSNAGTVIAGGR